MPVCIELVKYWCVDVFDSSSVQIDAPNRIVGYMYSMCLECYLMQKRF